MGFAVASPIFLWYICDMERKRVYEIIDGEQVYVDKGKEVEVSHIVDNFQLAHALGAIQHNLTKANESWYNGQEPFNDSMEYIRKIANICVQMGEKYGMPERDRSFEQFKGKTFPNG